MVYLSVSGALCLVMENIEERTDAIASTMAISPLASAVTMPPIPWPSDERIAPCEFG